MPANLPPDYHRAEERFRAARTPQDKIAALEEMLRVMPKHKGTDHLQADLRSRIARLRKQPMKKGARAAFSHYIPSEGAGQVALVGPANTGKSSLVAALTHAAPEVADYPFTTREATPGMMRFEDIAIQLIDLPPLSREHMDAWVFDLIRHADLLWLVMDALDPLGEMDTVREILAGRSLEPVPAPVGRVGSGPGPAPAGRGPASAPAAAAEAGAASRSSERRETTGRQSPGVAAEASGRSENAGRSTQRAVGGKSTRAEFDPGGSVGHRTKKGLLVATGADRPGVSAEIEALDDLLEHRWPVVTVSSVTGEGLDTLRRRTFEALEIIRVYTKQPGKPPDREAPFTLPRGARISDLAERIHKDLLASMKFARVWGPGTFDGQTVQKDHLLLEGDVVEIHA